MTATEKPLLLGAVDLGSNSFRVEVGRVGDDHLGHRAEPSAVRPFGVLGAFRTAPRADPEVAVLFADCLMRAFGQAYAAADAFVGDHQSHQCAPRR